MKKLTKQQIVFQNQDLLVFNKPSCVPVQSKSSDDSLINWVKQNVHPDYELCHRIDQVVSGVVLLSNNQPSLKKINLAFQNNTIKKSYLALVEKKSNLNKSGTFESFLVHDKKRRKAIIQDGTNKKAKKASIDFTVIGELDNYLLLKVTPLQGRFHQIRALLAGNSMPIKGDVKYGARRKNQDRSIYLHAWKVELPPSILGISHQFIAPLPDDNLWGICKSYI